MDHDASVVYEANQSDIHDHQATQDHVGHSDTSNYHDQQNQHNNIEQFQPQENAMPAEVQQPAPQQPAQYPPPQGNKPSPGYNPGGPSGPQVNFMFQNNNAGPNRPASYFQPQPAGQGQRGQMNNPPVQYPHQQYYQTNPAYSNGVHQPRSANPPGFAQNMGPYSGYQEAGPPPASFPPNSNGHMDYGVNSGYVGPSPVHGNGAAPGIPVPNPGPPVHVTPMKVPTEGWKTGLFECMDDPNNAVITAFCPCITFGQVAEILDNGHTSCTTSGLMYGLVAFLIGIPCIMSCSYRTKLRSKFNLIETPAPDWVTHFLCEWCALCQEYRELQLRGLDPSIGWQGNVDRVQAGFRQQQANMVPPMNQRMMP